MASLKDKANALKDIQEENCNDSDQYGVEETGGEPETAGSKKRSPGARIAAIIALLILAALFVWLIICIATGSKYTMAVIFCIIIYPLIIYFMLWLKKVFSS